MQSAMNSGDAGTGGKGREDKTRQEIEYEKAAKEKWDSLMILRVK